MRHNEVQETEIVHSGEEDGILGGVAGGSDKGTSCGRFASQTSSLQ